MGEPILSINNLTKTYALGLARRRYVKALDNISFKINRGEFVSLVGESGSGKTTLARIILRLTPPSSGEVIYKGKNVWSLSDEELRWYRKEVQGVFQDPYTSFNPFYKVDRALSVAVKKFLPGEDEHVVIRKVLESVRLNPDEVLGRYPHQLSGGQLQRIAIARALIPRPELLIADEYISMVDMSTRVDIVNLSRDLVDQYKMTIIMITHEMNMALYATDKMIVLFKGRIVEYGDTKKILKDPLHPYTQLMIEALPRIDKNIERKILQKTLDAQKKGLTESVRGCRFAYRCSFATERCFNEDPVLEEIDKDHYVACWLHNRR
ncbi:MAG: ABC transporter ATP-binding protein [Desulfurococcales archaeon]|nr:ABC transporter ATP-binding protein [Desulfurococcales archaeon]